MPWVVAVNSSMHPSVICAIYETPAPCIVGSGVVNAAGYLESLLLLWRACTLTRAQYLGFYGREGVTGIGTKAAMVVWLMVPAEKADLGTNVLSDDAFPDRRRSARRARRHGHRRSLWTVGLRL